MPYYAGLADKYTNTWLFLESFATAKDALFRYAGIDAEGAARIMGGSTHRYVAYYGASSPGLPGQDTGFTAWPNPTGPFTVHWTDASGAHSETLASEAAYWARLDGLSWFERMGQTSDPNRCWNVYGDFKRTPWDVNLARLTAP